ncbi:MAG: hypothetical protein HOD92_04825 [Deltaproteobacteria bacterium]|jgi:hypothetical protein|nr:hypothetical protein [Deltaproteobacteria bacterium]MBT4525114.1 hypothetical protein [Deltaproteobacteria bacterium]
MIKKIFLAIFVIFLTIYFFCLSIWLNIPPEKLTLWLNQIVIQKTTNQFEIKFKDVVPRWSGVDIAKVLITDKLKKNEIMDAQYIDIDVNPFSFLMNLGIPFKAEIYNGLVSGKLQFFPTRIIVDVAQINIRQIPLVFNTRILPAPVYMDIHSSFVLKEILSAEITVESQQFNISFNDTKFKNIVKLPTLSLKLFSMNGELQNNRLTIKASTYGDIVSKITGTIFINSKTIYRSGLDIQASGSLSSEYKNKVDPLVMQILKSFQNANGQIKLKIGGSVQYPKINKN